MATRKKGRQPAKSNRKATGYRLNDTLTLTEKQHTKLLDHLRGLMDLGAPMRDVRANRYEFIDREVYGYLLLSEDDKKRERDNRRGKGLKVVDVKLPMTLVKLEDAVVQSLLLLAPDEAMYNAVAPREQQDVAKGFAALMNQHDETFGHYAELAKFIFNAYKYNWAGIMAEWREIKGSQINNAAAGGVEIQHDQVLYAGNRLETTDAYNTFYDPAVEPKDVYQEGEFVAVVDLKRRFWLRKQAHYGRLFNLERLMDNSAFKARYYRQRPVIDPYAAAGIEGGTNWVSLLSMSTESDIEDVDVHERIRILVFLDPREYGLVPASEPSTMQVWEFHIGDSGVIMYGKAQDNAHGYLPLCITTPNDDGFGWQTKSWAEHLIPLNRFASFQMNVHQRAARKSLYGLLFYDSNLFPSLGSDEEDFVAGKIPARTTAQDIDFRKRVMQITDAPDTGNTMRDIGDIDKLMEQILPTQLQRQVADLERATQYQAAATVLGGSRRPLKLTKIINSQAINPLRFMQMQNIFQYASAIEIVGQDGNIVQADPTAFRNTKLVFAMSDGMKGLDRLTLIITIKEVLNNIIQSQAALQEFDVPALIDYWTGLIGDYTDFKQFRHQTPFDQLTPEQKQQAFLLLQQALQQAQEGGATALAGPAGPAG